MGRFGTVVFCGSMALRAGAVWAASAPSWESLPPMITPRGEHTATVLQDGRVLVAGGYPELDAFPYTDAGALSLQQVEIYDPATRTWSPAAPLGRGRAGHAAILLPNGHVLVAGGRQINRQTAGAELASAETYDPASNTWTAAGRLPLPPTDPSMMLVDGKPVLVGLAWSERAWLDVLHAAVYDPEARNWTELPTCDNTPRVRPVGATLLHDGRVMAVGSGCSLYDPETRLWTWEQRAVMSTSEYEYPHATTLPGGGVLVVGGTTSGPDPEVHAFAQIYLPDDRRWEPTSGPYAPASTPCRPPGGSSIMGLRTSLLPSGRALLTGGVQPCSPKDSEGTIFPFHATMALFDEATRAWSPLELEPPVTMARAYHSATPLRDGSVLIAGGYVDAATATASAMLFHERSQPGTGCDTDSDCGSGFCADSVCCDAACAGPCDACAAAAGASQDGVCTPLTGVACDDLDACTAGGVCEAGACVGGEAAPDGTPCSDGDVCSTASVCAGGACVGSSVEVCSPADECHEAPACDPTAGCAAPAPAKPDGAPCHVAGTEEGWRETGRLDAFLLDAQTTSLLDGTVLVFGQGVLRGSRTATGLWTRYDPSTGAWQPAAPLADMPTTYTPTLLPDGTVLVLGSGSVSTGESLTRRFDPATGVWAPAAPTIEPRWHHTATLMADGRLLVAGGGLSGGEGGTLVEVYDPVADAWTAAAPMNAPRLRHTATLLPDGGVLVTGGQHLTSNLASAEVYEPATDTWTPVASMGWARAKHTATLLPDGRVLVVGGTSDESGKTTEIYDPGSDTWTSAGEMATARKFPGAALLDDGRVLVTGDSLRSFDGALAAEIYDPASGTWAPAPALDVMIHRHATARLNDGRVLIAAGRAGPSSISGYQRIDNAWLYVPAKPGSRGTCQTGACVPGGDGSGGHGGGGSGGDGAGGGTSGSGGSDGGGSDGGGMGGPGGDATGGGGAGGMAAGGHGGEASGNGGGEASSAASGGGDSGGGDPASSTSSAVSGGSGGDASGGGDPAPSTSSAVSGGSGGDASGGGDPAPSTSSSGLSGTTVSSGGDPPGGAGGGGCHMTPSGQGAVSWLVVLGGLATVRLRRRVAQKSSSPESLLSQKRT
ncbi:Kelch repeat-containing protein [Sorangium cellulosum]|uniref:Kelch repeat-containing protein n=1 Tax=Sorangium cellulosum TaxID=56 RepID=UPI003D9A3667